MSTIFVSHSSKDTKVALRICSALEARGIACWIANRDINPGENFGEAIVSAIRSAGAMLLVFTSNANNSDEIKKELVLAGQNRLTVIPVRVEDVVPGGAFAYELATRQWIDLFDDWDREIDRLCAWILKILATAGGKAGGEAGGKAGAGPPPAGEADRDLASEKEPARRTEPSALRSPTPVRPLPVRPLPATAARPEASIPGAPGLVAAPSRFGRSAPEILLACTLAGLALIRILFLSFASAGRDVSRLDTVDLMAGYVANGLLCAIELWAASVVARGLDRSGRSVRVGGAICIAAEIAATGFGLFLIVVRCSKASCMPPPSQDRAFWFIVQYMFVSPLALGSMASLYRLWRKAGSTPDRGAARPASAFRPS